MALPQAAQAVPDPTTGTATVTGGGFGATLPTAVGFSATLDGSDQTVTAQQAFDVTDASGSGAGWTISATSTTFTHGSDTLPTDAVTIQDRPTVECDSGSACTLANPGTDPYAYSLPADTAAPPATTLYSAADGSGLGAQTVSAEMTLSVPAATKAGAYTSTWTYTVSPPV